MTKGEILEKYHTEQAMSVYAEQESIAFAEWVNESYTRDPDQDDSWMNRNRWVKHYGQVDMEYYTTAELYKEYLKSKTQTKP